MFQENIHLVLFISIPSTILVLMCEKNVNTFKNKILKNCFRKYFSQMNTYIVNNCPINDFHSQHNYPLLREFQMHLHPKNTR